MIKDQFTRLALVLQDTVCGGGSEIRMVVEARNKGQRKYGGNLLIKATRSLTHNQLAIRSGSLSAVGHSIDKLFSSSSHLRKEQSTRRQE